MEYTFFTYNENGYAVAEAYVGKNQPVHTLKLPLQEFYAEEVAYILDNEDWMDDAENYEHYKEMDWNGFTAGNTPPLVKWWLASLPTPTRKQRRESWIEPSKSTPLWKWLLGLIRWQRLS